MLLICKSANFNPSVVRRSLLEKDEPYLINRFKSAYRAYFNNTVITASDDKQISHDEAKQILERIDYGRFNDS